MEVGAVKQAFNNEIILLKKCLNQAKIQTIHKLTRKAKTFTEKKVPVPQKEKLMRKAESAVKEVLIIKKIKAREISRFIITHTGELNNFLNKPVVDKDKACARLLLHKALQEKYKHIREKFSNISIKDLFMSRQERRKLKKEIRDKQKNKKALKDNKSVTVNVEDGWDVEMTDETARAAPGDDQIIPNDDKLILKDDNSSNDDSENENIDEDESKHESDSDQPIVSESNESIVDNNVKNNCLVSRKNNSDVYDSEGEISNVKTISETELPQIKDVNSKSDNNKDTSIIKYMNNKHDKKTNANKNRNLNKKLEKRNFRNKSEETLNKVTRVVDPFFITSTGENYMSLVEPRQPDEVKEVHKEGNRQYRRAVMFGHAPKIKPKRNDFESRNNKFHNQNNFDMPNKQNNKLFNEKEDYGPKDRHTDRRNKKIDSVPEKLHPSWEAKKKQSGLLPFQGKKIVFDES